MRVDAPHQLRTLVAATSTTAAEILAARETRRRAVIQNNEAAGGIIIYVGADNAVASTTGFKLAGGYSVVITRRAAVWAESASGTPNLSIIEEYD